MGLEKDEYPIFKELQPKWVIKPAIKEINDLTDYHVESRIRNASDGKIGELKFRITKVKQMPDSRIAVPGHRESCTSVAVELVQVGD